MKSFTYTIVDPVAVSYTHLDVYKRQLFLPLSTLLDISSCRSFLPGPEIRDRAGRRGALPPLSRRKKPGHIQNRSARASFYLIQTGGGL